jgi:hypothetical protein
VRNSEEFAKRLRWIRYHIFYKKVYGCLNYHRLLFLQESLRMSSSHISESASPGRREESEGAPTSNVRFKQVVRLADLVLKKEKTKKTCPASINEQITLMQTGQAESVNVPYHVLDSIRSWFVDKNKVRFSNNVTDRDC